MQPRHTTVLGKPTHRPLALYDKWLILSVVGLLLIGVTMVASSSATISREMFHQPFHYVTRQLIYIGLGGMVGICVLRTDTEFWRRLSVPFLLGCIVLLLMVLIPGIGKVVNGSRRWIFVGPLGIQVSELAKLGMIFYTAGYFVRQGSDIEASVMGFIKPMLVLALVSVLLLQEPDFGATVVISGTVLMMLFLTPVKLRYYAGLVSLVTGSLVVLAVSSPYRMTRLTAFLNPWADQYNTGYQLTQSLIAFGRGGWFGAGLGDGLQKQFYLPEAHTDFLFAILAEEFGFIGILCVLALHTLLVIRGFTVGAVAFYKGRQFGAYTAYGITFWLGLQAAINMGVNTGLLPTKGLTLPLLSYGGASMVVSLVAIAVLIRIDFENRWEALGSPIELTIGRRKHSWQK